MIDLEKAKEEFKNYASNYDMELEEIRRKKEHSLRVMEISTKIAKSLNLSEEGVEIATLIGLLHDIARFEQFKQYGTYRDVDSIEHGDFGVKVLQENDYLRKYIDIKDYDNIILKAIKNHNKYEIEQGLTQEEELYAKIIRDADKADIFYEAAYMFWENAKEEVETAELTQYIEKEFHKKKSIKRKKGKGINQLDKMVTTIGFIFDIYYPETFRVLKENDYINIIINQFTFRDESTKAKIDKIREIANQYVEINQ